MFFAVGKGSELIPKEASLTKAKEIAPDAAIFAYGNFITVAINFSLLAFVVFIMVKSINQLKISKQKTQSQLFPLQKLY